MRLTKVSLRGFKGQNRSLNLAPVTVLCGPMGSGKTAIEQAITVGMLGYDPKVGKSLDGLRSLCLAPVTEINLEDSNGFTVRRRILQKGDGRMTADIAVFPQRGEEGSRAATARIGAEWGQAPIFFDLNEFLTLSPDKRRAFIYSLAASTGIAYTPAEVRSLVFAGAACDLAVFELLWGPLAEHFERFDLQQALSRALGDITTKINELNAAKKMARQMADGVTKELESYQAGPQTTGDLQRLLDESLEELRLADSALATAQEKREVVQRDARRLGVLKGLLAEIDKAAQEPMPDLAPLETKVAEAEKAVDDATALGVALTSANIETADAHRLRVDRVSSLDNMLFILRGELEATREFTCELSSMSLCAATKATHAKAHLETRLNETEALLHEAKSLAEWTLVARDRSVAELDAARRLWTSTTADLAAVRKLLASAQERVRGLQLKAEQTTGRKSSMVEEASALEATCAAPQDDLDTLTAHRESINQRVGELRVSLQMTGKREGLQIALNEAQASEAHAIDVVAVLGKMWDALGQAGIMGELTKKLLDPLESAANKALLSGLEVPWTLRFVTTDERGRDILDFGLQRNGDLVRWDGLSSGERLMIGAGLLLGMLSLIKPPLKVLLIDDLTLVDRSHRRAFINACANVIIGGFADTILIATNEEVECPPEVKVVNL